MLVYLKEQKEKLSKLLGEGHASFAAVIPRRGYRDDEEDGGAGASDLRWREHPLLANQPIGAALDLAHQTLANSESAEYLKERANEACPELKKQPGLAKLLSKGHFNAPKARPFR